MSGCDVLALFAHPDDESLLAGGTLAACAAAGLSVSVVSLTRGELGASDGLAAGERLARQREGELARAAAALGAASARCLRLPDGELASIDREQAVGEALELLAAQRPRLVLTFSAEGLYWHPDHIATREIAHAAAAETPICELTWPRGLLADTVAQLKRRGLPADVWGLDPDAFGAEPQTVMRELDVSAFLARKLAALRCHESQFGPTHALARLPEDLALRLLGREWLIASEAAEWLAGVLANTAKERTSQ